MRNRAARNPAARIESVDSIAISFCAAAGLELAELIRTSPADLLLRAGGFVASWLFSEDKNGTHRHAPTRPSQGDRSYPLFTLLAFRSLNAVKNETDYPCARRGTVMKRNVAMLHWTAVGLLSATLIGCAEYEAQQRVEERARAQARMADDAQCRSDGVEPGSPGYAQCRMNLDNQRAQLGNEVAAQH
jgi:hypothetical protein